MDTVQVVKELQQLAWTMGPDDEHVIHLVKQAQELVVRPLQRHFFKVLCEEVDFDGIVVNPWPCCQSAHRTAH
jgi:hypothetical protein